MSKPGFRLESWEIASIGNAFDGKINVHVVWYESWKKAARHFGLPILVCGTGDCVYFETDESIWFSPKLTLDQMTDVFNFFEVEEVEEVCNE